MEAPVDVPPAALDSVAALAVVRGISDPVPVAVRDRSPAALAVDPEAAVSVERDAPGSVRLPAVAAVSVPDAVEDAAPTPLALVLEGDPEVLVLLEELRFAIAEQPASIRMPVMRPAEELVPVSVVRLVV